jgi:t-SNARE complex subunit (syntaxin)
MADSTDKAQQLVVEAERGASARTPWLVLGGVHVIVIAVVVIVLAIVFTVYLLA